MKFGLNVHIRKLGVHLYILRGKTTITCKTNMWSFEGRVEEEKEGAREGMTKGKQP